MPAWFQDTLFGAVVRLVSGGRFFGWRDQWDETRRSELLYGTTKRPSNGSEQSVDVPTPPSGSPDRAEKGEKALLINWLENDSEVCRGLHWTSLQDLWLMGRAEPA